MADPLLLLEERLAAAFARRRRPAGRPGRPAVATAPTPRPTAPSPWPRSSAGRPRERGRGGRRRRPTSTASAVTSRSPGRASSTSPSTTAFLAGTVAAVAADERLGRRPRPTTPSASSSTTRRPTSPRRCTSATCAPRSSATRWCGCSTFARPHGHPGEPHRRLGHAVRHAHRAPARPRRGRGRATSCPSATSTASTSRPGRKFDADEEFQERARQRVVALQGGDPTTLRLWQPLVDESTRYFNAVYGRLGVLLTDDDLMGESAYNDLLPEVVRAPRRGRACSTSPTAPRSSSRPASPTATASRCRSSCARRDGGFNYATTRPRHA